MKCHNNIYVEGISRQSYSWELISTIDITQIENILNNNSIKNMHLRKNSHPFLHQRTSNITSPAYTPYHSPNNSIKYPNQTVSTRSPHKSKVKIKLISPTRTHSPSPIPKENHPPYHSPPKQPPTSPRVNSKPYPQIELGGKKQKQTTENNCNNISNVSINRHLQQSSLRMQGLSKKVGQGQPMRVLDNRMGVEAIKARVVFVEPIRRVEETFRPKESNRWPTDVAIQEEIPMEELKQSLKDELQGEQLMEIRQLQEEIIENNIKIQELLKSSKSSKQASKSSIQMNEQHQQGEMATKSARNPPVSHTHSLTEAAVLSQQTIINKLQFNTRKQLEQQLPLQERIRDQISVQTDQPESSWFSSSQKSWHSQNLSIVRNHQCQIMMVMTIEEVSLQQEESSHKLPSTHHLQSKPQPQSQTSLSHSKANSLAHSKITSLVHQTDVQHLEQSPMFVSNSKSPSKLSNSGYVSEQSPRQSLKNMEGPLKKSQAWSGIPNSKQSIASQTKEQSPAYQVIVSLKESRNSSQMTPLNSQSSIALQQEKKQMMEQNSVSKQAIPLKSQPGLSEKVEQKLSIKPMPENQSQQQIAKQVQRRMEQNVKESGFVKKSAEGKGEVSRKMRISNRMYL